MVSMKTILMFMMFLAGGLAASQAAINAQLSNHLSNPFQASFISFCVGAFALGLLLMGSQQGMPTLDSFRQMPPHYLIGGLCGSVFITCAIFLVPRIGVVNVLFLGLAGQMIVSIAIDSYGLFGVKRQHLGLAKILGLVLIIAGVICLKFNSANMGKNRLLDATSRVQGDSLNLGGIQQNTHVSVNGKVELSEQAEPIETKTLQSHLVQRMSRKVSRFNYSHPSHQDPFMTSADAMFNNSARRSKNARARVSRG